jgi:hypothetical protein
LVGQSNDALKTRSVKSGIGVISKAARDCRRRIHETQMICTLAQPVPAHPCPGQRYEVGLLPVSRASEPLWVRFGRRDYVCSTSGLPPDKLTTLLHRPSRQLWANKRRPGGADTPLSARLHVCLFARGRRSCAHGHICRRQSQACLLSVQTDCCRCRKRVRRMRRQRGQSGC